MAAEQLILKVEQVNVQLEVLQKKVFISLAYYLLIYLSHYLLTSQTHLIIIFFKLENMKNKGYHFSILQWVYLLKAFDIIIFLNLEVLQKVIISPLLWVQHWKASDNHPYKLGSPAEEGYDISSSYYFFPH